MTGHFACPRCELSQSETWRSDCPCCDGSGRSTAPVMLADGMICSIDKRVIWFEFDRRGRVAVGRLLEMPLLTLGIEEPLSIAVGVWITTSYGAEGMSANVNSAHDFGVAIAVLIETGRFEEVMSEWYRRRVKNVETAQVG